MKYFVSYQLESIGDPEIKDAVIELANPVVSEFDITVMKRAVCDVPSICHIIYWKRMESPE